MALLDRLLRTARDDRAIARPLWQAVIAAAREPRWYRELGVADSLAGRFDMVTLVLALALLRLEREPAGAEPAARLTELFVADMDGQLREVGVGDLVVGKHVGRLVSVLGGRLGALRAALAGAGGLAAAIARNVTLRDGHGPEPLAAAIAARHARIAALPLDRVLAGELTP